MTDVTGRHEDIAASVELVIPSADMADVLSTRGSLPAEEPPTPASRPSRSRRLLHLGVMVGPLIGAYFLFWELELYVLALIAAWIPAHILSELRS